MTSHAMHKGASGASSQTGGKGNDEKRRSSAGSAKASLTGDTGSSGCCILESGNGNNAFFCEATSADAECDVHSFGNESRGMQGNAPLVGNLLPLPALQPQLIRNSNASQQLSALCEEANSAMQFPLSRGSQVCGFRPVKRDGCCFYRSFLFGVLEALTNDLGRITVFRAFVEDRVLQKAISVGYAFWRVACLPVPTCIGLT